MLAPLAVCSVETRVATCSSASIFGPPDADAALFCPTVDDVAAIFCPTVDDVAALLALIASFGWRVAPAACKDFF